ncbi:hypothetical protein L9F63_018391 [Diploptera punctata]|uniref:Uncharacterized protein n=1 Tax=Diploptera punctata TaxID=6984 RepID=A0AAD7ZXV7_DIPPU|nr:hypothetical protein L9F63_018391 [Diploptera punctata]
MQQRWRACYSRPPVRNREVLFDFCGPNISYGAVYDIVHENLKFRKVSARWVPKNLTDDHKGQRMMASLDHLTRYTAQGHDFLEGIVTGDESWAYHYTPETKQASAVRRWLHSNQTDFYEQGILKLVTRWEKCVEKVGDYVEK